jgi:hypothetical protein
MRSDLEARSVALCEQQAALIWLRIAWNKCHPDLSRIAMSGGDVDDDRRACSFMLRQALLMIVR